jgi:hypothetical protein
MFSNGFDLSVPYRYVGMIPGVAGTIDDASVHDEYIRQFMLREQGGGQ